MNRPLSPIDCFRLGDVTIHNGDITCELIYRQSTAYGTNQTSLYLTYDKWAAMAEAAEKAMEEIENVK